MSQNKFMKSQDSNLNDDIPAFSKFNASVKDSGIIETNENVAIENKKLITEHFTDTSSPLKKTTKRNSDAPTTATNVKKRKVEEMSNSLTKPTTLLKFFGKKDSNKKQDVE